MTQHSLPVRIDVVSDFVCPWCYVGKRQLESAIAEWVRRHARPRIAWHAFQLNPGLPREGIARDRYLSEKFGSADHQRIFDRVSSAAAAVGLDLRFERIVRQPNTLAAHALVAALPAGPAQDALIEALFRAYFVDGADLTARETLLRVAARAGLEREVALGAIEDTAALEAVARADHALRAQGIEGVPMFVVDRRFAIHGAQGAEVILAALERARDERCAQDVDDPRAA